ncbi:hypothetical protein TNCV_3988241 [Trichonephila clavipes]|nr:hypothetical protein TNCV_3988241 [Trichonephila clavipes]
MRSLPRQLTVALHTQWRIVLKGAVKRRQWAEGVRPSEHVSDTFWVEKWTAPDVLKGWKNLEKKKGRRKRDERERGAGLGWRKGKSPALDGESMRGEPWLERTGRERERKGLSPRLEWKDDERRWR